MSLRLRGDGFDPALVESELGLCPKWIGIKGQPRIDKDGREWAPHTTNFWTHQVPLQPECGFDQQIQYLFEKLGDRVERVRELCSRVDVEGELFCGFGREAGRSGGDIIAPSTLRLLVDAGLSLSLDLYPPKLPRPNA
ncbi:MAG: DUF4279 domain-containing protein [Verrucomicrobiota bacterium]